MKPYRQVGLYDVTVKVKGILTSIVNSLGNVLLPRMSYYVQKKDNEKFDHLLVTALNAELFMALPVVAFFILEARMSFYSLSEVSIWQHQ